MRKVLIGFALGVAVSGTGPALAAQLLGDSGYLSGCTVTKDGDEVCYMPYVWSSAKKIECD